MGETKQNTRNRIAKEMGVSPSTIYRASEFTKGLDAAEEVVSGIEREILSGEIDTTQKEVIAIGKAAPEERRELVEELRLPKGEREARRRQRETLKDIHAVSAEMRRGGKLPPTTEQLLELVVTDLDTAIGILERNLTKCRDAFTDRRYKFLLDEIIEKMEKYTQKLRGEQNYD